VAERPLGDAAERARLTFRRLSGLDRSGPPPPQTLKGQPLRPWTIPNAIGYVRLALIPVFLAFAFSSGDGHSAVATTIFAVVGWTDYLDGIAARVTGQYSRMGALLDPLVDRLLVLALAGLETVGAILLYIGLAFVLAATAKYLRDGLAARPSSTG
jgi:cardiolipin synthase